MTDTIASQNIFTKIGNIVGSLKKNSVTLKNKLHQWCHHCKNILFEQILPAALKTPLDSTLVKEW